MEGLDAFNQVLRYGNARLVGERNISFFKGAGGTVDVGYLFLMVDMTDADKPQIKVRTWQPNQTPMDQLFHAGEFYR